MQNHVFGRSLISVLLLSASPVFADELQSLKADIAAQRRDIDAQRARLQSLEERLLGLMRASGADQIAPPPPLAADQSSPRPADRPAPSSPTQVGVAPAEREHSPDVAVISDQGGIVTKAGQLTIEPGVEYARADRNRVIFRGIQVPQSVLVGVFDINESRQDLLTATLGLRYGITSRLEINARLPYVYRSDISVLTATQQNQNGSTSDRTEVPARGHDVGDVEFGARYQLTNGRRGFPYIIAGVQGVAPTGTNPFYVARASGTGVATEAATGAGFWGVTPTLTALLPSDPAVLFGSVGYTRNFGSGFPGVQINQDVLIDYVKPGDAVQGSVGIGISLNPRLALSLGYAHNWSFGTRTDGRAIRRDAINGQTFVPFTSQLRDLQIGRLLVGISYRTSPSTTINWNIEIGATRDAPDVRTTLRIPFSFDVF